MNPVYFDSKIGTVHRAELEKILFFNGNELKVSKGILSSLSRFGLPRIVEERNTLRIEVDKTDDCQTLFALDSESGEASLLGLIIYYRKSIKEVVVLHIAVDEECASTGSYSEEMVVMRLIARLRSDAQKIKGVEHISIAYRGEDSDYSIIPLAKSH